MADQQVKGAVIEFFGASLAIVGLNAQKWAADGDSQAKKQDDSNGVVVDDGGVGCSLCGCSWRWLLAISLFVTGQVVQTAAFAFGSQSLVAAVSNLSLVTNAVVAHFWFHEPFSLRPRPIAVRGSGALALFVGWDLGAVMLVVVGTVVTGINATPPPPADPSVAQLRALFLAPPYLTCLALSLAAALMPLSWLRSNAGAVELATLPRHYGSLYALSAAAFASVSITLSKISVLLLKLTLQGANQFRGANAASSWAFTAGFILFAVVNLRVLNEGLGKFDASFVIPIYYVMSTLLTIVSGEVLYQTYVELWQHFWPKGTLFGAGLVLSLVGVNVIATPAPEDVDNVGGRGASAMGAGGEEDEEGGDDEEENEEVGLLKAVGRGRPQAAMVCGANGLPAQGAALAVPRTLRARTLGSTPPGASRARGGRSGGARLLSPPQMLRRMSSTGTTLEPGGQDFMYPTRMHRTGSMDMFAAVALMRQRSGSSAAPKELLPRVGASVDECARAQSSAVGVSFEMPAMRGAAEVAVTSSALPV